MADSDVQVTIGADASALVGASQQAVAAVQALGAALAQLGKDAAAGFGQVGQQSAETSKQMAKDWTAVINPIVSGFTTGMLQMAEGTKSFSQVMGRLGQTIVQEWLKSIDRMVTSWAASQLAQVQASIAGNAGKVAADKAGATQSLIISAETGLKRVFNEARQAAAGAYNAMAGIPIIGPELGAAAAAAVFGAVMALGVMQSAAGGYDIPAGVNPITQLHAEEMVLPARLANPLRDMLESNSAGFGGEGGAAARGDTHVHLNVAAMDGASVLRTLRNNKDHLKTVFQEIHRGGAAVAALG